MIELINSTSLWIGIIGVLVGSLLTVVREIFAEWRHRNRLLKYAAVRLTCTLDAFVQNCLNVVQDDGEEVPNNNEYVTQPSVDPPEIITFAEDIDWKILDTDFLYRIMQLPAVQQSAMREIGVAYDISFAPDYEEFFETRKEKFARLGQAALNLAVELRIKHKLPPLRIVSTDPADVFHRIVREYE